MYIHVDNVVKVYSSERACFVCEGGGKGFTGWLGMLRA